MLETDVHGVEALRRIVAALPEAERTPGARSGTAR